MFGEGPFLPGDSLLRVPSRGGRGEGSLEGHFNKATNLIHEAPSLPAITSGVRITIYDFNGDKRSACGTRSHWELVQRKRIGRKLSLQACEAVGSMELCHPDTIWPLAVLTVVCKGCSQHARPAIKYL